MSFLDNENQMLQDAIQSEISDHLFEQWLSSQLDEGVHWADYQIALLADDDYIKRRYNEYYELKKGDEYYIDVA